MADYATPENLGVLTDGEDVLFSPDSPSILSEDWFLQVAWGDLRLYSLLGRRSALSLLLTAERTAIIH